MHILAAQIYKVGLIRYVDVPADVSLALREGAATVPVCGTVEGLTLRTTMVSRGKSCCRLALHGDIRKKLRMDAGAIVEVALERDEESREPSLPPALVVALRQSPVAQAKFRGISTALRRQIVRYLTAVKQQATLERRVAKFMVRLEAMARTAKNRAVGRKAKGLTRKKRRAARTGRR
ncbi:MAG: YdeI/OmpD-associated family protein [Candidatus Acidiferrum sp.]